MSLRMKSALVFGILIVLAVLIVGTYNELIVNTASPIGTNLPRPTVEPLNGGAYPGNNNSSSIVPGSQAYPYPPPQLGANGYNLIPVLPVPSYFN
jgi:hypothetical protein